jgi:Outer membrane protein beta-barrel domain
MTAITRLMKIGVLAAALAAFVPATALAQAQEREGFWFGFGLGVGSADATCDECEGDRQTGAAGAIRLGWTLNPRVLLGIESGAWTKTEDEDGADVTINMYNVSGTLTLYPSETAGFFVKGGAGLAFVNSEIKGGNTTIDSDMGNGLGLLAGIGYDFRLGRRVRLTPALDAYYGNIGDVKVGDETLATGWKQNVVALTIGLTFP